MSLESDESIQSKRIDDKHGYEYRKIQPIVGGISFSVILTKKLCD